MVVHRGRTVVAGAALGLTVGLLVAPAPQALAAPEDLPGRLVLTYASYSPGQAEERRLVSTTPAGADEQLLIPLGAGAQFGHISRPDWSTGDAKVTFEARTDPSALSDVWVADGDLSDPVRLTDGAEYEESPTWSPDGSTIAYVRFADQPPYNHQVRLMDADGGNDRLLLDWPGTSLGEVAWHPTDQVLVARAGLDIFTIDVTDPAPQLLFTSPGSAIDLPVWSPDGATLAVTVEVTGLNYDIFMLDPADGSAVNYTDTPGKAEFTPAWSPDGTALAWVEWDGPFVHTGVWVRELATGTHTHVLPIDPDVEGYGLLGWVSGFPDPPGDPDGVDTEVGAGETVGTDPEGDGATPEDPVETSVTTPVAGVVTIAEGPVTGTPPASYAFFGQEIAITAPPATADDPLVLRFRIDLSVLPAGAAAVDVVPFRNGTPLPDCAGAPGVAAPDPCRASAVLEGDGDVTVTVLTSAASTWNFGVSTVPPDTTPPAITLNTPQDGTTYGRDQAVLADYACSDEQSAVTRCEGTTAAGSLVPTSAFGQATLRVEAEDAAGNAAAASASYRVVGRRSVLPTVTCVRRGAGGWWTARFGYVNRNTYRLFLPTGIRNGFTSGPVDRGQPTLLAPGPVGHAVEVTFRTSVSWRLDGTTATARTSSRRC